MQAFPPAAEAAPWITKAAYAAWDECWRMIAVEQVYKHDTT
jgi:hypothetical protein